MSTSIITIIQNIINDINNNEELNIIERIIKGVIYKLVDKQINKQINKNDVEFYYDLESIYELQHKKYYHPTGNNNEYYEMNKDYYYRLLFRKISEDNKLNDILQKLLKKNSTTNNNNFKLFTDILKTNTINDNINDTINKNIHCSFRIAFLKDKDKDNTTITIKIPINDNKKALTYFNNNFNNNFSNNVIGNINNSNDFFNFLSIDKYTNEISIHFYFKYEEYVKNNKNNKNNKNKQIIPLNTEEDYNKYYPLIFFYFLYYLIGLCKNKYSITNTTVIFKNETIGHQNVIIFNTNENGVVGIHYEPHGSDGGYSYNTFNISDTFEKIKEYSTKYNNEYKKFPIFKIEEKLASCPLGPQNLINTNNNDIGYCSIISTFWYNCLINIIASINIIESKLNTKKLSNLPLSNWIAKIDNCLTSIKKEYTLKYNTKENFKISYLLEVKNYLFDDHYKKYIQGNINNINKKNNGIENCINILKDYLKKPLLSQKSKVEEYLNTAIKELEDKIKNNNSLIIKAKTYIIVNNFFQKLSNNDSIKTNRDISQMVSNIINDIKNSDSSDSSDFKNTIIIFDKNKKSNENIIGELKNYINSKVELLINNGVEIQKLYESLTSFDNYKKNISKLYENNKLYTINEFLQIYYNNLIEIINRMNIYYIKNGDIQLLLNDENKNNRMNALDYYNIFVNYTYYIIHYIYNSEYFSQQKENLKEYISGNQKLDESSVRSLKKVTGDKYKTEHSNFVKNLTTT